jgi:hypothetical protein
MQKKNLHLLFPAVAQLAEGLCHNVLLMLKVENSFICLVGT